MGEISEAMLEGTLCQYRGVYLGNGKGIPQSCNNCKPKKKKRKKKKQ